MNVRATAKFVGTSSRKVGLVAALIRGRSAAEARSILKAHPKRAAGPVGKVLGSAMANAENNYNLSERGLVVESVLVGPGPTVKRYRPRAQGRAFPVRKRTSHITVVLSDKAAAAFQPASAKAEASEPPREDAAQPEQAAAPAKDKPKKEETT